MRGSDATVLSFRCPAFALDRSLGHIDYSHCYKRRNKENSRERGPDRPVKRWKHHELSDDDFSDATRAAVLTGPCAYL